ncbi:MAG: TlyA family RNA methyltransferase [Ruminococcaceae bacterium]|nr:TlyA family RNA methyltransferase [Oscillospiraceae bacterium]
MRLDVYLTEQGLVQSRARAKRFIESGAVCVDGTVIDKPSFEVKGAPAVTLTQERFVGRGGEKLLAALSRFSIDPAGCRALDIGASTGGFTDCLLQNGAAEVVALDAGCGQLHPKLLADSRVRNLEKYNARNLSVADIGKVSLVVMDVSFISQTYILPRIPDLLTPDGKVLTLIKPQFEAGRLALNKKGIVKNPKDRMNAIRRVLQSATESGLSCRGLSPSPILGGDGNEEYLAYFVLGESDGSHLAIPVEKIVLEGVIYP